MDDSQEIRALLEGWIVAVDAGDADVTLSGRTADVVMYDVPGPSEAARGLDAYRAVWPDFLRWQRAEGVFQLRSLDVTAGTDVAFAHALLHCGPAGASDVPERRLRITFGLRKVDGAWLVAHEHHSFPDHGAGGPDQPPGG